MDLVRTEASYSPARLTGNETFILDERTKIRAQIREPGGVWEEVLDEQVPLGKKWTAVVNVKVVEETV